MSHFARQFEIVCFNVLGCFCVETSNVLVTPYI